jgi:hypothetical protein
MKFIDIIPASCGDMVAIKCKRSENTLAFPALKRNTPNIPRIDLESLDINRPGASKPSTSESETVNNYCRYQ